MGKCGEGVGHIQLGVTPVERDTVEKVKNAALSEPRSLDILVAQQPQQTMACGCIFGGGTDKIAMALCVVSSHANQQSWWLLHAGLHACGTQPALSRCSSSHTAKSRCVAWQYSSALANASGWVLPLLKYSHSEKQVRCWAVQQRFRKDSWLESCSSLRLNAARGRCVAWQCSSALDGALE